MKKVSFALLLVFLLSLSLSACDLLAPDVDDGFYFGGEITPDTSRRPDEGGVVDDTPEAGIGDNKPTDLPYLPLS